MANLEMYYNWYWIKTGSNWTFQPLVFSCITHQKYVSEKCLNMSDAISVANFMSFTGVDHWKCGEFIEEIRENNLPFHTAVRLLSCRKLLERFVNFEQRATFSWKNYNLNEFQNRQHSWQVLIDKYSETGILIKRFVQTGPETS